jgi:hypothetical protein
MVSHAEIRLLNGETVHAVGTLDEVEKELSDAARSGSSRFAWLTENDTGKQVRINPDHVVSLRLGEG